MLFVPVGTGRASRDEEGGAVHMCVRACILYTLLEDCEELIIAPFSWSKLSQRGESR